MNKKELQQLIIRQGVLPLYFHRSKERSIKLLEVLHRAGIHAVEYTYRGAEALENFKAMKDYAQTHLPDMKLGIGTLKNAETTQKLIDAGADFIVSPGFIEEVAEISKKNEILWIPGCMTPSEIIKAENHGIGFVKLFPGSLLGPDFVKAIKPLFPNLSFMPTGGVDITQDNLQKWFAAGVSAVGIGSKLLRKEWVAEEAYGLIEESTQNVLKIIEQIRNQA